LRELFKHRTESSTEHLFDILKDLFLTSILMVKILSTKIEKKRSLDMLLTR